MTPRSIHSNIELNETETNISNLLLEFCNHYNTTTTSDQLELRITGGWVRDKLLGRESNDLDVAINHLSGEDFVNKLTGYLSEHHPDLPLNTFHTIKKNPEKSKHLETCTTKIYGLDIDFVNLRSEKYSQDSRIPIIEYGTAEEDALRRDATLNALFYNLNDQKIEDFTKHGINDLKNGILRTPLKPLQTFLDDPLRVLRLIRFASRFNFTIESDTLNAMKDIEIKTSLLHKISKERIGVEIDKMLNSQNPEYGLNLLNYVSIADTIFNLENLKQELVKLGADASTIQSLNDVLPSQIHASTLLAPTFKTILANSETPISKAFGGVSPKLFWLSVILAPFRNFPIENASPKVLNEYYMPKHIIREGLKFGKHEFEPISKVLSQLDNSKLVVNKVLDNQIKRSDFGIYLREFGDYVNLNVIINCFDEILNAVNVYHEVRVPVPDQKINMDEELVAIMNEKISKYDLFLQKIHEAGLENVGSLKPIMDGKMISKELNKKPGPWMAKVTHQVLIWQLDNPEGSPQECLEYIKSVV